MDPRLRDFYELELQHLREMGVEFAQEFPKIAGRLGMNGLEQVADPYVERLLEGVAFMAARVQLKLDAEFPRFTQALLEILYPHYLAPTPAAIVARMSPDTTDANLAPGVTIPRHTLMHSALAGDDVTACEFRTAHEVTLWPIEIAAASYFSFAPDLPLSGLPVEKRIKGGLRIRLRSTAGLTFKQTRLNRLSFYVTGRDDVANRLYEFCTASCLGVLVRPLKVATPSHEFLPAAALEPAGFEDRHAILPVTLRSFQGYRLLQEYFAFPARYRFFDISGLERATATSGTDELEVVILLGQGDPSFDRLVDASNLALFCTPAVNIFPKRADRIQVSDEFSEYHVVPDRTRPQDFEVYAVTDAVGHGEGAETEQQFRPIYAAYAADGARAQSAYFVARREPRLISSTVKRRGPRSSYVGTEVFLSLVDSEHAPYSGTLRQLSVQTLCTNRDLVLQMPIGTGRTDLALDIAAPVSTIRVISGPSRPFSPLTDGAVAWRAINHLSLNYLSLVETTPAEGASALRELLELYVPGEDATARAQIEAIRSIDVGRVVRRLPLPGPLAFGRGLEIAVTVTESAFAGGSAFLLGAVLARYFARHVSINSFTETVLRSTERGEIHRWVPRCGLRQTL